MIELFAGTCYWNAVLLPRDSLHSVAMKLSAEYLPSSRIVTSELVLAEFLGHFSRTGKLGREQALNSWQELHSNPNVTIVPATQTLLQAAALLYGQADDKAWSLADCASFVIMRERKILNALTFDRHFEQAGFRAMMREEG